MSLPLHRGRCPSWLYPRMRELASKIVDYIMEEYGEEELIKRISNPTWFQSLSNVLGFDWHSSGATTTTASALKEAINKRDEIKAAGGKGKTSLKTPEEIKNNGEKLGIEIEKLIEASKIIAKVDNSLIQDGYTLYHHTFFFTKNSYAVVQQGMNGKRRRARRYHWLSRMQFFGKEQLISGFEEDKVLVIVGKENEKLRKLMVDISKEIKLPSRHEIYEKIDLSKRDVEFFKRVKNINPSTFKELISIRGMGSKKIRALALISSLIYGEELEWKDPVKYSFAHGGKDGIPYPVDKKMYDESIEFMRETLENLKFKRGEEKIKAGVMKKIHEFAFKG